MNKDKLIGYMTYYFRVENDTQVAYTKIHTDFRKLPRFMFFNRIKKKVADVYRETGMKVTSVNFCSEKEYETNKSEDFVIEHEWNDEKAGE
jgi:hypothetical protein